MRITPRSGFDWEGRTLEDFGLETEGVARFYRARPAQFIHAEPDRAAGQAQFAGHEKIHAHRRRVPAARDQLLEHALLRGGRVQMKRLRIEVSRERKDAFLRHLESCPIQIGRPRASLRDIFRSSTAHPKRIIARSKLLPCHSERSGAQRNGVEEPLFLTSDVALQDKVRGASASLSMTKKSRPPPRRTSSSLYSSR